VIEAFYRSLHEGVQDSELPMEPATLTKKYLSEYHHNDGSAIDMKQSSFKKIGKLLDLQAKLDVIDYLEPKGGDHKLITRINRKTFMGFVPQFRLKRIKRQQQEAQSHVFGDYPKVNI